MAVSSEPRIYAFLAGGAVPKGSAVKFGSDDEHVVVGAANTDRCFGIAQNAAAAAEDELEIAIHGGGAKGLLSETVTRGDFLVSHTDGSLALPNADGDVIIAQAMESGVVGDLINVEVVLAVAAAAI